MFYENRAKNTLFPLPANFSNTKEHKKATSLNSQLSSIKSKEDPSSGLYHPILESQSSLLKKKAFTEVKRINLLKKEYLKTRNNNFLTGRSNNSPISKDSERKNTENNTKKDKINKLFIQIVKDQEDGIKSPDDLNCSYRKGRRKLANLNLTDKINRSPFLKNLKTTTKFTTLANFPSMGEIKTSLNLDPESKYKFSPNDSKFLEILNLKKKNHILKKEMINLQNELVVQEDFPYGPMGKKLNDQEKFNEKRVSLLKSQINKQKRYIKNLHKSLRLIKKFYRDMTSILTLFKNLDVRYAEMLKTHESFIYKKPRNINRNDLSMMKEIDNKQKNDSLQQILHGGKNSETLERFINNFNEAYEKVKGFDRKNEELKRIFEITDVKFTKDYKDKVKKIKYNYLIREFIQKYTKYLPIKTFFDVLEPKEKDSIDGQINNLIKLMEKIEEVFKQISSFDSLKNNTFYSQLSVPDVLKDNLCSFEGFLTDNQRKININLNYQDISKLESSLSLLLRDLSIFQINLSTNKEKNTLESLMDLQKNLRGNIEKLLELGIILTENDDPLVILQQEAGFPTNNNNINNNDKKPLELLSFKNNLYKNELNINNDYHKIYSYLQESIIDLEENLINVLDDGSKNKLHSFKYYLITLNKLYEQKKVTSFLKELDLSMQEQKINQINKGFDSLKEQILEKMKTFEEIFGNISEKILKVEENFNVLFENVDEDKKKIVLNLSRKVQNIFKYMHLSIEKKINQKEFNDINTNLMGLDEEYNVKIKVVQDKWSQFSKRIKNILDTLNQNIK